MTEWIKDKVQPGLFKRKRDGGDVWAVKARIKGGQPITYTIGKSNLFSLAVARAETRRILAMLAQGVSPAAEIARQRVVDNARRFTLEQAITEYSNSASWKSKTKVEVLATLKRSFKDWYLMPLGTITKRDCQSRFLYIKKRVATKKSKIDKLRLENGQSVRPPRNEVGLGEAQRAFRYLNAVFSSFLQDDIGEDRLLPLGNPCQILKAKKLRKVLKPRERFLDDSQRSLLYDTLASASNPEYPGSIQPNDADLIWLLLHTGLRLDEARTMLWSSVDFLKEAFTAYDTKNHKDHTLPMTAATKEMFVRRYDTKTGNYVFPSPLDSDKPMSASRTFDRVCGEVGFEFTAHDLRRTFATVAADLGYDINTIGSLLNHAKGGVTAGYIQRTQKRFKNVLEAIQDGLFAQPFDETEEMQEPIVAYRVN